MDVLDLMTVGIFLGVAATIASLAIGLFMLFGASERRLARRLARLHQRWRATDPHIAIVLSVKRDEEKTTLGRMVARMLPRRDMLAQRLVRTGRSITPGEYVLAHFLTTFVATAFGLGVFALPATYALLGGIVAGIALPYLVTAVMIRRRAQKFLALFPDALDLIVRGLKSGLPVTESITLVGSEMPDPVGAEFRLISDRIKFGTPLDEALIETSTRVDVAEFKFFAVSLSVQRETGGNLSETLHNLATIVRRRRQMRLKIRAMSSEARASAYIIGALPFIMLGVIYLMNKDYVMVLFNDPRGMILGGAGLFSLILGVLAMAKMVRFEI